MKRHLRALAVVPTNREYGEWYRDIQPDGKITGNKTDDWKGPYHHARACLEVLRRLESLGVK